MKEVDTQDQ